MLKSCMKPVVLGSCWLLASCALSQAQPDAPAVITQPSAASRLELLTAVSAALKVANVTLAEDALTRSSTLIIERAHPRDASGRQLSGRDFDRPQHFQLVKNGRRCLLIHQESRQRTELKKTRCAPVR